MYLKRVYPTNRMKFYAFSLAALLGLWYSPPPGCAAQVSLMAHPSSAVRNSSHTQHLQKRHPAHTSNSSLHQQNLNADLLQAAWMTGTPAEVKRLLDQGADVNARTPGTDQYDNSDGNTPLMMAALGGRVDIMRVLLDRGAHIDARSATGWTPLMNGTNSAASVRVLLARGANVNDRDKQGISVLMHAMSWTQNCDRYAVVQQLLKAGADVKAKDYSGENALTAALRAEPYPAPWYIHADQVIVKELINRGADVNASVSNGFTPLIVAADSSDITILKALLAHHANVNAKASFDGVTALMYVGAPKEPPAKVLAKAELLIRYGADVNATDKAGKTALIWAAEDRMLPVVKLLLARGAHINARTKNGNTALQWARVNHDVKMVRFLQGAGAS